MRKLTQQEFVDKANLVHNYKLVTNSSTVEDITICDDVTIGAGACVSKDIIDNGIYVGVPAKKLEKKNG
jgi:acetyltransferase-like isoleucine patch superfamily enzyme